MLSSLIKLPFIVVVATCFYIANHRPNRTVPKNERVVGTKLREAILFQLPKAKFLALILGLVEIALVLSENFRPGQTRGGSIYLTPLSAIGVLAVLAGTILRLRCFQMLGPSFTFELTFQDNQKLIKHGPYGVVRHPSYSAGYVAGVGAVLFYFVPGSLLFNTTTWASRSFAIFFVALILLTMYLMLLRTNEEDRLMRQRFGKEWEDWAKGVPYKLVPYLY